MESTLILNSSIFNINNIYFSKFIAFILEKVLTKLNSYVLSVFTNFSENLFKSFEKFFVNSINNRIFRIN